MLTEFDRLTVRDIDRATRALAAWDAAHAEADE